jgi:hypothetical protein
LSEFDSAEKEGDDFDDEGGELVDAASAIQRVQSLMQDGSIQQRMQQIQQQMSADAPPEVRAAEERMRSGRGTAADMQQYQAWAMQQMPKYMDDMRALLGGALGIQPARERPAARPQAHRQQTRAQRAEQRERLAALRPLLAAGESEEAVKDVLQRQAVFAEDTLAEFLPLIGINADYAHASYVYSRESTGTPLAAGGVPFAHDLRFERC